MNILTAFTFINLSIPVVLLILCFARNKYTYVLPLLYISFFYSLYIIDIHFVIGIRNELYRWAFRIGLSILLVSMLVDNSVMWWRERKDKCLIDIMKDLENGDR